MEKKMILQILGMMLILLFFAAAVSALETVVTISIVDNQGNLIPHAGFFVAKGYGVSSIDLIKGEAELFSNYKMIGPSGSETISLPEGMYSIVASYGGGGYESNSLDIGGGQGISMIREIALNPTTKGTVIFKVASIPNAQVRMREESYLTDNEGFTRPITLEQGTYSYTITKGGYDDYSGTKEIKAGRIDLSFIQLTESDSADDTPIPSSSGGGGGATAPTPSSGGGGGGQGGGCYDRDGGKDVFEKGIAAGIWDRCFSKYKILERYCTENNEGADYIDECPLGYICDDGACIESDLDDREEKLPPEKREREEAPQEEEIPQKEVAAIPPICNGCILGDKCAPIGYRVEGKYCNINSEFKEQKSSEENCDNNFECESNLCVDEECISGGLLRRILNWFKKFF